MAFNRHTEPGTDGDTWDRRDQYPAYPPPPEYFQSSIQPYPIAPTEADADLFHAPTQPGATTRPLGSDHPGAVYEHETPTNQLTDIRYDQPRKRSKWAKAGGGAGAGILATMLKFGTIILGGLKYALFALKLGPFLSIIISLPFYAAVFGGWAIGIGIICLIFLHEMGHILVLKAKGIPASAPIFIPLMGAFVAMKRMPQNAKDEAEIAIAGPIAGTIAALLCLVPYFAGDRSGLWPFLAYFGFFINLLNLIPFSPLDGGRVVGAISRKVWPIGLVLLGALLFLRFNFILLLIVAFLLFAAYQQYRHPVQSQSYYQVPLSTKIFITLAYFGLAAFLAVMMFYTESLIPLAASY